MRISENIPTMLYSITAISYRQSLRGRKVAAIPPVKKENLLKTKNPGGSNAPGPTGYGYTRGSQEFFESRGSLSRTVRERPSGDQGVQLR